MKKERTIHCRCIMAHSKEEEHDDASSNWDPAVKIGLAVGGDFDDHVPVCAVYLIPRERMPRKGSVQIRIEDEELLWQNGQQHNKSEPKEPHESRPAQLAVTGAENDPKFAFVFV